MSYREVFISIMVPIIPVFLIWRQASPSDQKIFHFDDNDIYREKNYWKMSFFKAWIVPLVIRRRNLKPYLKQKIPGGAYPRTPWSCDCRKPRLRANTRFGVRIFILSDSQLFSEPETLYPTVWNGWTTVHLILGCSIEIRLSFPSCVHELLKAVQRMTPHFDHFRHLSRGSH